MKSLIIMTYLFAHSRALPFTLDWVFQKEVGTYLRNPGRPPSPARAGP